MENFYTARAQIRANRQSDDGESDEYPFPLEISNDRIDSYYTHMRNSSLTNFRDDAGKGNGVGILEGHKSDTLPIGRTSDARISVTDDSETHKENGKRRRVIADSFMIRGMELNNLTYASTDGVIRAIDRGILTDVSVGFYDAFFRCDICNRDIFEGGFWKYFGYVDEEDDVCPHFLGETYEIDGEEQLCTAGIEGARLAEVSIVYSGATPEAGILRGIEQKARAFYTHGRLDDRSVSRLNDRFNLRMAPREWGQADPKRRIFDMGIAEMLRDAKIEGLPEDDKTGEKGVRWLIEQHRTISAESEKLQNQVEEGEAAVEERDRLKDQVAELETERDKLVEDADLNQELVDGSKKLREQVKGLTQRNEKLEEARELSKTVETERDELKARVEELDGQIEGLNAKIAENEELAKLGGDARKTLIDTALESGVRAGKIDDESKDGMRETLEGMELDQIRERISFWEEVAEERFPGGRHSKDPSTSDPDPGQQARVATVRELQAFGIRA